MNKSEGGPVMKDRLDAQYMSYEVVLALYPSKRLQDRCISASEGLGRVLMCMRTTMFPVYGVAIGWTGVDEVTRSRCGCSSIRI